MSFPLHPGYQLPGMGANVDGNVNPIPPISHIAFRPYQGTYIVAQGTELGVWSHQKNILRIHSHEDDILGLTVYHSRLSGNKHLAKSSVTSNYNGSNGNNHNNNSNSSSYKFSRDPTCNDLIATCSKDGRCLIYEGLGASNVTYNQNPEDLSELGVLKPIFTPNPIKPKVF
jgi:hypothetical protein